MDKNHFLEDINETIVNETRVSRIEKVYKCTLNAQAKKIISYSNKTIFFDNDIRLLSFAEILNASKELQTDFNKLGMIPMFDCGENSFIVYKIKGGKWSKYHLNDNIEYSSGSLDKLL